MIEKLGRKVPTEITLTVCKRCARIKNGNDFFEKDDALLQNLLERHFKEWELRLISSIENAAIVDLSKPDENIEGIRQEIAIKYKKQLCPKCNRRAASYYEGIIQLRGDPERIQKMIKKLEQVFEANDEFFSKIEDVGTGVNIFISSKKVAAAFFMERGLKPVRSYELYGMKNGKKLYRNTYALHLD